MISERHRRTFDMAEIALMSGLLCSLAPMAIPLPGTAVPVTLGTFVVYLTAALLGAKKGTISILIYLCLGLVGLPVFSGFAGGAGVLLGPTGGYLLGYVPCGLFVGWLLADGDRQSRYVLCRFKGSSHAEAEEKAGKKPGCKKVSLAKNAAVLCAGTLLCYLFGTVWFMLLMGGAVTLPQALLLCVVPYLLFDGIKILLAAWVIVPVRRMLKRAGL